MVTSTSATSGSTGSSSNILDSLDVKEQKDMFLKLLVAQLKNQDPSSPMDQKDMMAQMAQFSTVEQLSNVAQSINQMQKNASFSQAVGMIGHSVDYIDGDGNMVINVPVTAVSAAGGDLKLILGDGTNITPSDVVRVS